MKNVFGIVAVIMLFACPSLVKAQGKIGHLSVQELVQSLPEFKKAQTDLQNYVNDMQKTDADMQQEYQEKVAKYLKDSISMTQPMKESKRQEIEDLAKRIQTFESGSDQKMQDKQMQLLKPIQDKVMTAVKAEAKESGYSYIFDTSNGSALVYYPEGEDLTNTVKKKIGGSGGEAGAGQKTNPNMPPKK